MSASPDAAAVTSSAELLAIARVMEERSAERYRELAEAFEISNNLETADAFRDLAETEERHVTEFPAAGTAPKVLPWGEEDPEIADPDAVHYLMLPWHAFDLALRHEQKAQAFFTDIASQSKVPEVREAAARLAAREADHVAALKQRLDQLPMPPDDWDEDDDPPNWEAGD